MANPQSFNLTGKVALVTGAGVGIGYAVALTLAQAGAFVGIHCNRSRDGAEDALAKIRAMKSDGIVLQADLTDEAAANNVVDQLVAKAGRLDILVNNAGALLERASIENT